MKYVPTEDKNSTKLKSIAQDLVNLPCGGRNPIPKSIALAMALTVHN